MLALARQKVPEGEFHEADLHDIPLADDSVDLVVCAVALSHVPDLDARSRSCTRPPARRTPCALRLARPDRRHRAPLVRVGPDGAVGYMPVWSRLASDYLAAALPLGLQVRRCEEPRRPSPLAPGGRDPGPRAGGPPNIWALHAYAVEATNAAWRGQPAAIVWHFQLSRGGG